MLLTIATTWRPATDLGYLLVKNPARCQSFPLPFGQAHVFYPEAGEDRCQAALLLDLDPVGLVRRPRGANSGDGGALRQYVNDRPYVASSFLSVALARVFGSALKGNSKDRPELADTPIPLEAEVAVLPCRGGEPFLRRLFEPLGYAVEARRRPLDERFPEWGESPYYQVRLAASCRLRDLLSHLYVLLPVLDDDKHYWVGQEELDKLLARGEGWLSSHPEREQIARRYLKHQRYLAREALERLTAEEDPPAGAGPEVEQEEESLERPISLNEQRLAAVREALREAGARSVIDLGCGEGKLLRALLDEGECERIAGMDVSFRALEIARERLSLERRPAPQRERLELFQGSLTYRDDRLSGYDAACAVEVIEHIDPPRLPAFERVLFEFAQSATVIVTTPNADYNSRFDSLPAGLFRHRDHRFEWTRRQFRDWAQAAAARCGYSVRFLPIGEEDEDLGPPTQMAVFSR